MKRAGALLGVLLAALAPGAGANPQAASVFERVAPSVYSVLAVHDTEALAQGSGIVVAPGRVATNYHVIADASRISVRQGSTSYEASVERSDPAHDLALLRVDGLDAPVVAFGGTVRIGQSVYAVGSPRGLELSLSEGIVSSLRSSEDGQVIQTTAPISPGSSGGGLFDEEGRLVGLTTAQAVEGQNLNFAIPTAWLLRLGIAVVPETTELRATATAPLPAAIAVPTLPQEPATVAAAAPAEQAPAAATHKAKARRTVIVGSIVIALLLLLAKPATHWVVAALEHEPPGSPAAGKPARHVPPAAADRLQPYRQRARDELARHARDETTWARALEQGGGAEARALLAYVELRAQQLYRAELDRKWAEAQAQSQGPVPPRR